MVGVLIASKEEFKVLLEVYNIGDNSLEKYPYGEYYRTIFHNKDIVFFRSGSRKTMASGSVQYMIDKFDIKELYVLGTASASSELLSSIFITTPLPVTSVNPNSVFIVFIFSCIFVSSLLF